MAHLRGSAGPETSGWCSALVPLLLLLSVLTGPTSAVSEPGKWTVNVSDVSYLTGWLAGWLALAVDSFFFRVFPGKQ